jgi:hypothetical protein
MNDMGEILAQARDRQGIETHSSFLGARVVWQCVSRRFELGLDECLFEIGLEIVKEADEIVFRRCHERALDVDHHESTGRCGASGVEMQILRLEIPVTEAKWRRFDHLSNPLEKPIHLVDFKRTRRTIQDQGNHPIEPFPALGLEQSSIEGACERGNQRRVPIEILKSRDEPTGFAVERSSLRSGCVAQRLVSDVFEQVNTLDGRVEEAARNGESRLFKKSADWLESRFGQPGWSVGDAAWDRQIRPIARPVVLDSGDQRARLLAVQEDAVKTACSHSPRHRFDSHGRATQPLSKQPREGGTILLREVHRAICA